MNKKNLGTCIFIFYRLQFSHCQKLSGGINEIKRTEQNFLDYLSASWPAEFAVLFRGHSLCYRQPLLVHGGRLAPSDPGHFSEGDVTGLNPLDSFIPRRLKSS
jgi:hypothetical protein